MPTDLTFQQAIEIFRAQEQLETIVILLGKTPMHESLRRIFVAWQNAPPRFKSNKPLKFHDGPTLWADLWAVVEPDLAGLRRITGLTGDPTRYLDILIGNRLLYPDGTVAESGRKALRSLAKTMLKL